jgi:hypothetical protein
MLFYSHFWADETISRFAAGLPEILTGQLAPGDSTTAKETSTRREGAQGTERAKEIQICSSC